MRNKKDSKLVNIYIRIHNKQVITMDDLAYLAKYNPVCFKKTCDNLIYNRQATKAPAKTPEKTVVATVKRDTPAETKRTAFELTAGELLQNEWMIKQIMENFKKMESSEAGAVNTLLNVDMFQVKKLLGDFFDGSIFPQNSVQLYFEAAGTGSTFNVRV